MDIVPVCVPVPETRTLLGIPCVIESGTGTGQRPGHGHEFPPETAGPVVLYSQ